MLTEEQKSIRDMVRDLARDKIAPGARMRDQFAMFPREQIESMAELGLLGMLIPDEWGGADAGVLNFCLAIEEIAAADGALSTILSVHSSPSSTCILKYGNDEQKERFLKPLASGQWIGGFALTEPGAGSDASAMKTRAYRDGDDYVINGSKQFITSGKNGDVIIVFAVTDPDAGKKGMSAFIVPTDTPGYNVTRVEEKMGQHASDTCALNFDDMRISAANRLGAEGQGYAIALANLEGGRLGIASQSVGMARAAYDAALSYAKDRHSFGRALMDHQAVAFKLADMATQIEAARLMIHNAARMKDAGIACTREACMAKLFASEMAERVVHDAIQIHGGYGYLADFPLERIYRDVRVTTIYEGTSDIQRMVIAREIAKENA
ncbi:acyl-CoA dehydrogenase family protein [Micavibrio aeruginosavorus]|uniref:Cyclohexane-1-carbonyl-CoA dehydrogenase n=1 Tax=Micavibrio aeruginosavorus EPB TaxID=349215 RepID=M4VGJ6_9BACT|nr:acyl-CoA dehydrogenase family protein [Micavibrio aeruginosavorus]AGH97600.1 Butyryl-CoA dehydrogenase [Micavibrio aeruginosavorus EPB]